MSLTVMTVEQSGRWNQIVQSFACYDVYYLSGYVKAFQLHGDGEPLLFYYEGDGVRGINVVMKRDIADDPHFTGKLPKDTYFDFATPYGYGGWLIEGEGNKEKLFEEYESWCNRHRIISEFVRFHSVLQNQQGSKTAYEVIPLGETISLDLSSPETIWGNLTTKNRNVIRKAKKSGVKIYNGRFPQIFETFRTIYNKTMDKDHAKAYYYFDKPFYRSILDDLPQNAQMFYAELDGEVIAASIMLAANGLMSYHLSGSVREFAGLAPTNLLLYEAALWGYANGCKTLHLGGGVGSGEDSLFKFKKSFYRGEDLNRFFIGKKVIDPLVFEELTAMRKELPDSGYFPKYRA